MMTVERVTVQFVQETMKGFFEELMEDDDDVSEFNEDAVTQQLVDEMNAEITGFNVKEGSASSYVPKTMFEVLADEDLVNEEYEERFLKWFESQHS